MAEYITRDSALAFQCEVEPVMCKSIVTGEVFSATPDAALVKFFNALPFADVREVVYCKDCRHRDPEDHKCDCGGSERQGCPFPVDDDYFCAYGEA